MNIEHIYLPTYPQETRKCLNHWRNFHFHLQKCKIAEEEEIQSPAKLICLPFKGEFFSFSYVERSVGLSLTLSLFFLFNQIIYYLHKFHRWMHQMLVIMIDIHIRLLLLSSSAPANNVMHIVDFSMTSICEARTALPL